MDVADLDYELPPDRIAQRPLAQRDRSRLLVDRGPGAPARHAHVADLPSLLGPGDLLVVNTTRVRPARLHLRKETGGAVEVLLLERRPDGTWEALVRPGRRLPPGTRATAPDGGLAVEIGADLGEGRRLVRVEVPGAGEAEDDAIARVGQVPLPPYIAEPLVDAERYQTVYAEQPGSVAAPTAGLHLTPALLQACRAAGAEVAPVDLCIGLGTFRPMVADRVQDHVMHAERYEVPATTLAACRRAGRVVAVGTTSVRALESAAASGELTGRTELFIHGDRPFAIVDVLLTNFHQPRSSLLALVDAFVGPRWRQLYAEALAEGYRFLSFGDAMLLERRPGQGAPRSHREER